MESCIDKRGGCYHVDGDDNINNKCIASSQNKLNTYNWLKGYPKNSDERDIVEVRFKSTRKDFFENVNGLHPQEGDMVAVESSPGHDIGIVSLTGPLVYKQLKKLKRKDKDLKKIYRVARTTDIEKWEQVVALENKTMLRSRQITAQLKLNMKIGDVEYQGDKTKAIFYYIADERVDFRELIKLLAEEFNVRVEMCQIGARQETGRIGGIGSCGQELCCSKWMSTFSSVSTSAAREQEVSLNPQKLAGQCGKLKCCLNFELDVYKDAKKNFPDSSVVLDTENGSAYYHKSDILQGIMWYSFDSRSAVNLTPVKIDRVREIIDLNKKNIKVASLNEEDFNAKPILDFDNIVGQDSLTRFDKKKKSNKRKNKKRFFKKKKNENKS